MKRNLVYAAAVMVLALSLAAAAQDAATAPSATPPVSASVLLQQYLDSLQSNPTSTSLRKRIITLVRSMPQAPSLPGKLYQLQGEAKAAGESNNYKDAEAALKQASLLAPWIADIYFDLAQLQETTKQFDDAIASYKLYLFAEGPGAADRPKIEQQIGIDQESAKEAAKVAAQQEKVQQAEEAVKMKQEAAAQAAAQARFLRQPQQFSVSISTQDLYITGSETTPFTWPDGTVSTLALRLLSTVHRDSTLGADYIAVIDIVPGSGVYQQTFRMQPMHRQQFYLRTPGNLHQRYRFMISIGGDGGITLYRGQGRKEAIAYSSTAQLILDREDQVQKDAAAQVQLDGQPFSVLGQGGPFACLLFFATSPDGQTLLRNPLGAYPAEVPNMMACIRHVGGGGGLQPAENVTSVQCLGEYGTGSARNAFTIQPVSGGTFEVRTINPGTPPCH